MKFKVSFSKKTLVIWATILLIVSISLTVEPKDNANIFEKAVNAVFLPIQSVVKWPYNKVKGTIDFFVGMKRYAIENEELKKENIELKEKVRKLEIDGIENNELRNMLNLTKKYSTANAIVGEIISADAMWFEVITVNKGEKDGVKENMTVLTPYGLVGKVTKVYGNSSQVTTILDATNAVGVRVTKTGEIAIARGDINLVKDSLLKLEYLATDMPLNIDDVIETSGIGGIYPKGIYVGKVKEIVEEENLTSRYALIEPGVGFNKLSEVLIIDNSKEE